MEDGNLFHYADLFSAAFSQIPEAGLRSISKNVKVIFENPSSKTVLSLASVLAKLISIRAARLPLVILVRLRRKRPIDREQILQSLFLPIWIKNPKNKHFYGE